MKKEVTGWAQLCARWAVVAGVAALVGCASGGKLQGPTGAFQALQPAHANGGVVVFIRDEGASGRVPLVLANDRVVGSLLEGRYAQGRICAGTFMAGVADRADVVGVPTYQSLSASVGEPVYLAVSETPEGRFELQQLAAEVAQARLQKLKIASHIIDRHAPDCSPKVVAAAPTPAQAVPAAAVPAMPVVLKRIQLGADAMFRFDRSGDGDMLPEGRAALIKLVDEIQRSAIVVERMRLTGHTDRLGTPAYNLRLSQQRAETVANFLRKAGLTMPIEAVGKGEDEPVTTACVGQRPTPALIGCLQPDRRVTVDLIGQMRQQGAAQTK